MQLPQAFDIEGERERREHIILRSLLLLVPGVDAMMVDRMLAAGLNTLQTLAKARADELAAVAGIPMPLATRIVAPCAPSAAPPGVSLAAADVAEEKKRLKALVAKLASEHDGFERACRGWTEAHREEKRRFRREREHDLPARQGLAGPPGRPRPHRPARAAAVRQQDPGAGEPVPALGGQRASGARTSSPLLQRRKRSLRQRDT